MGDTQHRRPLVQALDRQRRIEDWIVMRLPEGEFRLEASTPGLVRGIRQLTGVS